MTAITAWQAPPAASLLAAGRVWPLWLVAAWVVPSVVALLSVWLGRHHSFKAKAIWTPLVLIPVLGPLAWFLLGREKRRKA
ncbi:MAG: PLDc N-terminal domain-containing protein [Gemmatimonadaceae bacterium]